MGVHVVVTRVLAWVVEDSQLIFVSKFGKKKGKFSKNNQNFKNDNFGENVGKFGENLLFRFDQQLSYSSNQL